MSEEIKYEAVFGPQKLFNNRLNDVVMVIEVFSGESWEFTSADVGMQYLIDKTNREFSYSVAMRRIIKEPVWAVADQKAGRLPEVGVGCFKCNAQDERTVIAVTDKYVGIESDKGLMDPYFITHAEFIQYYKPIETPEERAQRLEDEFVLKFKNGSEFYELDDDYEAGLRDAFRALSGELQAPNGVDHE